MTTWIESQRFVCQACKRNWVTIKDVPCEDCYGVGWDALMRAAVEGTARHCAADDCPNWADPKDRDWFCLEHAHLHVMEQVRNDRLYDAEMDRRRRERAGN
jgi:hypothetical protein